VETILRGFFKAANIESGEDSLSLYNDNRESPVEYTGDFNVQSIVSFVLEQLDTIISTRSEEAKALKDLQEYQEREKERANKEWADEQELRKKSNTILLDYQNWETLFLKEREPFLINFYEANNSACIGLNKEWELLST